MTTVGWDHSPVRLFVRDYGPKPRLVCFILPLAQQERDRRFR